MGVDLARSSLPQARAQAPFYRWPMETTNLTALALIPDGDAWPPIQELRRKHDRQVQIWPPHMNVLYPFVPEESFEAVAHRLAQEMAKLGPVRVRFRSMGHFGGTVYLRPECDADPGLARLHQACAAALPGLTQKHEFIPHLTIGQFKRASKAQDFIERSEPVDFEARITCLSLLARDTMKQPFRTSLRVRFGASDAEGVECGDLVPYACDAPWRYTFSCLPLCTRDAAGGLGTLARAVSGQLTRSLSRALSSSSPKVAPAPCSPACGEDEGSAAAGSAAAAASAQVTSTKPKRGASVLAELRLVSATTIVLVPPPQQWEPFVKLKKEHMKKKMMRPPYPHITIQDRFVPPADLGVACAALASALASVEPFDVHVGEVKVFPESANIVLEAESHPAAAFKELEAVLAGSLPQRTYKSVPHIGLGHFGKHDKAKDNLDGYKEAWAPISFSVRHVFVLELVEKDEPWTVAAAIPLAGVPDGETPALAIGSRTCLDEQMPREASK